MVEDRISKLSDPQKECLRLTAAGRSSKEIAPVIGLSHNTVNIYLSRAASTLGATNRRDAARIFADFEGQCLYNRVIYNSPAVAEPSEPENVAFQIEAPAEGPSRLGLPPTWGSTDELGALGKFLGIGRAAVFLMIAATAIIVIARGAFNLLS